METCIGLTPISVVYVLNIIIIIIISLSLFISFLLLFWPMLSYVFPYFVL